MERKKEASKKETSNVVAENHSAPIKCKEAVGASKTFLKVCRHVKKTYPLLWDHSRKHNRWIMVQYHLPGGQLKLF